MLLNRVLSKVLQKQWQQSATIENHLSFLIWTKSSNNTSALVTTGFIFIAGSQRCFELNYFQFLKTDVDCWFLSRREAPRCSWGEIYASSSCRNADTLGKQKLSVQPQRLMNWHGHNLSTVIIPWAFGISVSMSYIKQATNAFICFN